jgi:hypothetical protein
MYPDDQSPESGFARIVGMDPAADWLLGPALQDYLPPGGGEMLIPLLLRVDNPEVLAVLNRLQPRADDPRRSRFRVLALDSQDGRALRLGRFFAAFASLEFLKELAEGGDELRTLRAGAKQIQLGLPFRADAVQAGEVKDAISGEAPPPVCPRGDWPEGTIVVGVIDDGVAFAHERFRTAAGLTRFEAFWNQDGKPPSPSVDYGIEHGRAAIDTLLQTHRTAGLTDEDAIYRAAGLADFSRQGHKSVAFRAAHGTHVLDLAAGPEPGKPLPANRPIIGVQLRVSSTASQSGPGLDWDVRNAVTYILDRARRLTVPGAPLLPVVINFSYATHAGPHDGTSWLEQAIEQAIEDARQIGGVTARVVLPAGNTHLSRCHAAVSFKKSDEAVDLGLRLQPDDRTLSAVEFWLPPSAGAPPAASRVSLSIEAPDGAVGTVAEAVGSELKLERNGLVYCRGSYSFVGTPTLRGCFRLDFAPTARLLPDMAAVAPAGRWLVRLTNAGLTPAESIHAWIARDDLVFGYPRRGRQAYFEKICYRRFDELGRELTDPPQPPCEVQRSSMVSGIATGASPLVVGGMLRKERRVASYSAGGPVISPAVGPSMSAERRPHLLVHSEDSKVHAGVLAAGARSGSAVAMRGTSVAAPQLTRWIADRLAENGASGRAAVIDLAVSQEGGLPAPQAVPLPDGPPLSRSGWGRAPGIGTHSGAGRRYWWP